MRLPVRSRSGNIVLAIIGSVYAVSALAILGWFVFDAWSAAAISDHLLQFVLVAAAACGLWLVVSALRNLGLVHHHHHTGVSYAASIHR
jgi:hypothetical protein